MFDGLKISIAQKLYPVHMAESREEYEAIWALRYRVFVDELKRHDHPDADHDRRLIRLPDDESDNTCVLYTGKKGQVKGTLILRLYPPGAVSDSFRETYALERFEDIGTRTISELHGATTIGVSSAAPISPATNQR